LRKRRDQDKAEVENMRAESNERTQSPKERKLS